MKTSAQILPQFTKIKLLKSEDTDLKFESNCAYLLEENSSISKFIEKIGKKYEKSNENLNLYDFYTAYNIKFPTVPATVSLIDNKRLIAMGIHNFEELLQKICEYSKEDFPIAVLLYIQERTPDEMLKIKRAILQQFIFLRMYVPIIVSEDFRSAVKTFNEILNSKLDEKTDITFIGTKKSGKSSLINAILGAEYTPSSSELPTPNKVSYLWNDADKNSISVEYDGNKKIFNNAVEVNEFLSRKFNFANKNSSALKPMKVYVQNFPEDLRDFIITDTPGPNFAASKEHTEVTEDTLKDIRHCIFIMNYSAHLTDDEIFLFEKVYKVLNNKRRHQTIIVAVNRIDEMYAADVIKSYERFADYILRRLNALGYENIVVVSISAITSVYIEKIRQLISDTDKNSLDKQLKNLRREYKGTDKSTEISFVEKSLETLADFHGVEIENLQELKKTSRVNYLIKLAESMYSPFEQFDWIDETFEDVFETDFENDEEFFERVLKFAEQGDTDAMDFVGILYNIGNGVEENEVKAFEWFKKSADLGNALAMNHLAGCYRYGRGTQKNLPKAVEWLNKAAELGEIESIVDLGAMYFRGEGVVKNETTAFNWSMKAAELGNTVAMDNVAYQYRNGLGVAKNSANAVEWYSKAADGGDYSAMCELAEMYQLGEGVQKNLSEAFKLYRKAAEAGEVDAMLSLGAMYFKGDGVAKNEVTAFNWNMKAAEHGNTVAMNNIAYQYRNGLGVAKNSANAVEWYSKAADGGNYSAMCELAEMYQLGEGIYEDEDRALELYKRAAEAGFEYAFESLAMIYYDRKNYSRAFEWFEKAAGNEYVLSMFYLGSMYESGDGVEQNYYKSFEWFKKAADNGYSYAMDKIAFYYAEGLGVQKNFSEAVFWYEKAIDSGDEYAIAELGDLYYEGEYYTKAFKYYRLAAENGNAEYMNRVGVMYSSGKGVTQDSYEAARWYRKAAENNNAWGMYNLAGCYRDGEGVHKNSDEAIRWYKKAAGNGIKDAFSGLAWLYYTRENYFEAFKWYKKAVEGGNIYAMNDLGNLYYSGKGVAQDYFESTKWYRKAADNGVAWGMYNLANNYRNGRGTHKNLDEAIRWYKKAAENGIDDALKELGEIYYGIGDYNQTIYWYKKAAEKGNASCMNKIGVMYADGKGVSEDQNEAVKWYRKAMEAGSVWAIHNLGYCYCYGKGVAENNARAFEYFSKAAEKGISDSMIFLGHMYKNGYYISRDYNQAVYWYRKAHEAGNEDAKKYIDEIYSERNRSSSSGGCFITTAVCDSLNKPDDCSELTTFRNFRDNWLMHQPDGKKLIDEYYSIAPKIVAKINENTNSEVIYRSIWKEFLLPCLEFIGCGNNIACKEKYIEMVHCLQKNWGCEKISVNRNFCGNE